MWYGLIQDIRVQRLNKTYVCSHLSLTEARVLNTVTEGMDSHHMVLQKG